MTKEESLLLAKKVSRLPSRKERLAYVNWITPWLKADNKSFNPDKFKQACII